MVNFYKIIWRLSCLLIVYLLIFLLSACVKSKDISHENQWDVNDSDNSIKDEIDQEDEDETKNDNSSSKLDLYKSLLKQKEVELKNISSNLNSKEDIEAAKNLISEIEQIIEEVKVEDDLTTSIKDVVNNATALISTMQKVLMAENSIEVLETPEHLIAACNAYNQALNHIEDLNSEQQKTFLDRLISVQYKLSENLVLQAEKTKDEADIAFAKAFIMDTPSYKRQDFLNRLENIRIQKAEELISNADREPNKDTILKAYKAINRLSEKTVQKPLLEKLKYILEKCNINSWSEIPAPVIEIKDGFVYIRETEIEQQTIIEQPIIDDFESGSCNNEIYGDWTRNTQKSYSGNYSLISKAIGHNEESNAYLNIKIPEDSIGIISFRYCVSSQKDHDWFSVYINERRVLKESGEVEWTSFERELLQGDYLIVFKYTKDSSTISGLDTAFIDDVVVTIKTSDYSPPNIPTRLEFQLDDEEWQVYDKPIPIDSIASTKKISARVVDSLGFISPKAKIYLNEEN